MRPQKTLLRSIGPVVRSIGQQWLERTDHAAAPILARAAGEARKDLLLPDERDWSERIESERVRLYNDGATLIVRSSEYTGDSTDDDEITESTVADAARTASKPRRWGIWLHKLVAARRVRLGVELGTCVGLSAAYQGAAMKLNGGGRFATFEASHGRVDVARDTIKRLGLDDIVEVHHGRFVDALPPFLEGLDGIEYAFIDGHHDGPATIKYFEMMLPHLTEEAIVVFDDIRWSGGGGMLDAWNHLRKHHAVGLAVDMRSVGVVVTGGSRKHVIAPL